VGVFAHVCFFHFTQTHKAPFFLPIPCERINRFFTFSLRKKKTNKQIRHPATRRTEENNAFLQFGPRFCEIQQDRMACVLYSSIAAIETWSAAVRAFATRKKINQTHTHTHTHELETKRTKKVEEGGRKICRGICGGRERKKTGIHPAGMAGRRRITDLLGGRS